MALQVWLPLNGTLENKGLSNVTVTNNGATVDNNGKIGKCYSFDGSANKKITGTISPTITSSVGSIACWVRFNSFPNSSSFYELVHIGTSGGYAACLFGIYMEYTNHINISINGSSTGTNCYTHSLSTNTWYHLCATLDGTTVKLYINGSEVLSKTATKASYNTAASTVYIGGTTSYWLNGRINDVRIYDHTLSPKEVKEISKGLILHYKLDGNDIGITIPRNGGLIPDGVELYDYIQSSGTQYIKMGTTFDDTSTFEIKIKRGTTSNNVSSLIGYRQTDAATGVGNMRFVFIYSTGQIGMRFGANYDNSSSNLDTNSHILTFDGTNLKSDGTTINSVTSKYSTSDYQESYLFNCNATYTSDIHPFIGTLYYCKFYKNGILIRNFIPCTYLGEPGMWDTVENKFYRNQGTGQFTLGNKITLKEYEYLKGDSTGYLDTNVIATANTKLKFSFKEAQNSSTTYYPLCHVSGTGIEFFTKANTGYAVWAGGEKLVNGPNTTNLVDIELTHNYCKTNGTVLVSDYGTHSLTLPNVTIPIFGFRKADNSLDSRKGSHMLYYFQIYEDNQLIRDFIPVSYNGTPGLWDKVEWKFYANAGSGSFTLGPEKTVQQDAPIFYDSSGYCNHGSITGTLTTNSDSPRYTNSIQFGSDKLISTTASGPHILTMSIWAKDNGSIPSDGLMFKDHLGDMALGIQSNILYSGKSGGQGAGSISISNINYTVNTWHHWVMVNRNNTYYVYMDGQQVLSGTSGSWSAGTVTNALHIGGRSGSSPWPGKLSDFRAYATALSEEDILELYNTSAFVTDNGVFAEYELYEDNLSDVKKRGLLETANFYENGAESGYALDTDKTRVASNYIISEEFIEI